MGFFLKDPGKRLIHSLKSRDAEYGRVRLKSGGRTISQASKETLHWKNIWLVVSSAKPHRAQREGPRMPLFHKFSAVNSLLCNRVQMKLFTFGMLSGCHTFFQSLSPVLGSVVIVLYYPANPQPRRSMTETWDGDRPWRKERREATAFARYAGGVSSFQPVHCPIMSH